MFVNQQNGKIAQPIMWQPFNKLSKTIFANHTRSAQVEAFLPGKQLNLRRQTSSSWKLWGSLLWMSHLRHELFLQCSWTSSRQARWSSVRRGTLMAPAWSRFAWRECAPTSRPGLSSRTRTARWAPGFVNSPVPLLWFVFFSPQLQLYTHHAYVLLQDIFWAVYVGKCCVKMISHHCTVFCRTLQLLIDLLSVFRRRPVCREALQEWSHVFGQRGRLRLRLQVGFHRGPLWKWWGADVGIIIVNSHLCCAVTAATFAFCFHDADVTQCTVESGKGCSQFCKPGYTSYECSCAQGWKLSRSDRNKCEPAGTSVSSIKFQLKLKCFFFFFPATAYISALYIRFHIRNRKGRNSHFISLCFMMVAAIFSL